MIVGGRAKPSPQVHVDMYINRISLLVGEKNRTFSIRGIRESDGSRRLTYPIHSAGLEDCRPTTTPLAPQLISPIPPRRKAGHGSCPGLDRFAQRPHARLRDKTTAAFSLKNGFLKIVLFPLKWVHLLPLLSFPPKANTNTESQLPAPQSNLPLRQVRLINWDTIQEALLAGAKTKTQLG